MSVTFSAAMNPIIGFDLQCVCDARYLAEGEPLMSYEVALATLATVKAANRGLANCEDDDCFTYGIYTHAVEEGEVSPTLNMANGNSIAVLEALGLKSDEQSFEEVCCGGVTAEDFMGRVLMALAVAPVSAERPTVVEVNAAHANGLGAHEGAVVVDRGPTMIHCGVGEGYVQDKLAALMDLATFCVEHNRDVVWS